MRLQAILDRDEDGVWVVECPSIPGCVSQGTTREEALKNIQEAIGLCLEVSAERGLPLIGACSRACEGQPQGEVVSFETPELLFKVLTQERMEKIGKKKKGPAGMPALPGDPWRSRGYLPHFDQSRLVQSLTFRLHDAVPDSMVQSWKTALGWVENLPSMDAREVELRKLISRYEDAGHGSCWLGDARIAALVENALLHFDEQRYRLIAWCIMPNHVHGLIETWAAWPLCSVVHSWKSYTAQVANQILGRAGDFWFREYFDRFIRDERHFANAVEYIQMNPVKAGMVGRREEWRWSSGWWGR